jgi:hypothetical protein
MRKLVPILGCVLASMESFAQTDEPWQPFVLSRVAPTLEPAQVAVEVGGGYNGLPQGKTARLDDAYQGSSWLNGSVGLFKGVELSGTVGVSQVPARGWGLADGRAEVRFKLFERPFGLPLNVGVSAGYQRDWQQQNAAEAALLLSSEVGRLRFVANVRAAHYFHANRDSLDVFATAGAAVRLFNWLQGGVEYLGEELEGVGGTEIDAGRGGRHFVGPSSTVVLPGSKLRLNMTGGPLFTPVGSSLLVRGSVGYVF